MQFVTSFLYKSHSYIHMFLFEMRMLNNIGKFRVSLNSMLYRNNLYIKSPQYKPVIVYVYGRFLKWRGHRVVFYQNSKFKNWKDNNKLWSYFRLRVLETYSTNDVKILDQFSHWKKDTKLGFSERYQNYHLLSKREGTCNILDGILDHLLWHENAEIRWRLD